jgi:hypothetical protein
MEKTKPVQSLNTFRESDFYGLCFRCEQKISKSMLIHDGGVLLCHTCKGIIDNNYEIEMSKEELWLS